MTAYASGSKTKASALPPNTRSRSSAFSNGCTASASPAQAWAWRFSRKVSNAWVDGSDWSPPPTRAAGFGSNYEKRKNLFLMNPEPTILLVDDSEGDRYLMSVAFKKAQFNRLFEAVGGG